MNNLAVRTISGVVFVALTLASLIIWPHNPYPFIILFSFYLIRTTYEYLRLTIGSGKVWLKIYALFAVLCTFLIASSCIVPTFNQSGDMCADGQAILIFISLPTLVLAFFAIPIIDLFSGEKGGFEYVWSALGYIAVPFASLALLPLVAAPDFEFDGWVIASLLIIMWMGDVGAYSIGTAFGQGKNGHKLMPSVSPKKSWEGVFGAVAVSVITALILRLCGVLMPDYGYWLSALFGLIICVFSILGDLVESKLKRRFQVKDSGRIMPGHGGFLDRFDSGLLAFPAAFVFYFLIQILFIKIVE